MNTLIPILLCSLLAGLLSVLAACLFLLLPERHRISVLPHLVSLATGTLLGTAFLGLLPEALAQVDGAAASRITLSVLLGLVLFFLLEKMVIWRHCHTEHCAGHTEVPMRSGRGAGTLILMGDAIHNFVDGALIAGAFLTDFRLGVLTGLAVAAHEIPQEVGDFAILLHSGYSRRDAIVYNVAVSLATVAGALLAWLGLSYLAGALPYVLAIAASSFIYVAVADLIPGLHERTAVNESVAQVSLIAVGISLVYGLDQVLH